MSLLWWQLSLPSRKERNCFPCTVRPGGEVCSSASSQRSHWATGYIYKILVLFYFHHIDLQQGRDFFSSQESRTDIRTRRRYDLKEIENKVYAHALLMQLLCRFFPHVVSVIWSTEQGLNRDTVRRWKKSRLGKLFLLSMFLLIKKYSSQRVNSRIHFEPSSLILFCNI